MELREELLSQALQLRGELLAREQQLRNSFLSHVSHELRSPLTAIYQFTTILLDGLAGEVNEHQREYLEIALRNVRQLQVMIDDLLTASRARAGGLGVRPERILLAAAVADALEALRGPAEAKRIALAASADEGLPAGYADSSMVRQILIHLIHNAIKFTPEGGEVGVGIGVHEADPRFLIVEVKDTGCGIAADQLATLFERVSHAEETSASPRQGLGLGLFIARELATRQGGQIWASSVPGQGSSFSFTVAAFSLARVIAPVVHHARRETDSLTLVVVDGFPKGAAPSAEELHAALAQARGILHQCLVPDFEVLLPELDGSASSQRLYVVASVEQNAGQSAVDRMREHLARSEALRRTGLYFSATAIGLEPLPSAVRFEERLEALAAKIEGLVREGAPGPERRRSRRSTEQG